MNAVDGQAETVQVSPGGSDVIRRTSPAATTDDVRDFLREVIDPELGVNIVDLGLVYAVSQGADGGVAIRMTLTTPGCPLGGYLDDEIRACLVQVPGVGRVDVTLIWDPPWQPAMMSDRGRAELGWRA